MKETIVFALALGFANVAFANDGDEIQRVPAALVSKLNTWLDTEAEYRKGDSSPRVEFIGSAQAEDLHGVADHSGGRTRGLYDAETATIFLTEPWSSDNLRDVSVLLHEMVHHRQSGQHWYCQQAQEWRAYKIQAQWLAEQNLEDDFYWPAIVLQSSCSKRDIHPDSTVGKG